MSTSTRSSLIVTLLSTLPLACAADAEDQDGGVGCEGGKCDANDPLVCEIANMTGLSGVDVASHGDPLANFVLKGGESCPTTFAEVMEKLRAADKEGCDGNDGNRSAAVSETAQAVGAPTNYRVVTTRECDGRSAHELLFSLFGISAGDKALPENAEVIAFDKAAGVFNYYTIEGGEWGFHGNSADFIDGEGGRCKGCHTGGGLIMKELDLPWLHWEGETTTPGVSDLISAHADLGGQTDGAEVESIVRQGNSDWQPARMNHLLRTGDLERVLEPLFCTVEFNIQSATSSPGSQISRIPGDALIDSKLGFVDVSMKREVYETALKDAGQQVLERPGKPLKDKGGKIVVDTLFKFSFPERAAADDDFVSDLDSRGIVDNEFILDALAIDFTRPIFSAERCGLLQFAPKLDRLIEDGAEPKAIKDLPKLVREGFIANLEAAAPAPESPEGQFLIALRGDADADKHQERASAFADACGKRDQKAFMNDVMAVISQRRDEARTHEVMEFAPTLPFSSLEPDDAVRLHPGTCELVEGFVGILTAGEEPPPAATGCLNIAEVFYDVAGSGDSGHEWIKLYNSCDDAQSLDGMSLGWGGGDYLVGGIDLSGDIDGKACLIVGGPDSDETNGTPAVDIKEALSPNLQDSGATADGVALFSVVEDAVTTETIPVDAVIYGGSNDSGLLDAAGERPEPHVGDAPAGSTILRTGPASWEISTPVPAECPNF